MGDGDLEASRGTDPVAQRASGRGDRPGDGRRQRGAGTPRTPTARRNEVEPGAGAEDAPAEACYGVCPRTRKASAASRQRRHRSRGPQAGRGLPTHTRGRTEASTRAASSVSRQGQWPAPRQSSPSSTDDGMRTWSPLCTAANAAPPKSPTRSASAGPPSTAPSKGNATKHAPTSLKRRRDADLEHVLSVPHPTPQRDTWRRPVTADAAARTGFALRDGATRVTENLRPSTH